MSSLFYLMANFNNAISEWDTSNVEIMKEMFYRAENFN